MQNLISLRGICFAYKNGAEAQQIFNNFNFCLPAPSHPEQNHNTRMGLTGSNGAGKTTLLRLIMGLLKPGSGEIEIFNQPRRSEKDFFAARCEIGFVFQDAEDQLFCPTVQEDIAFGPLNLGLSSQEAKARVAEVLAEIGLQDYGPRVTYTLSGGEKKLVSLGTALAMRPRLLILDEPTAGLDEHAVARLENILLNSNLPYLIVSHDHDFLARTVTNFKHLNTPIAKP